MKLCEIRQRVNEDLTLAAIAIAVLGALANGGIETYYRWYLPRKERRMPLTASKDDLIRHDLAAEVINSQLSLIRDRAMAERFLGRLIRQIALEHRVSERYVGHLLVQMTRQGGGDAQV
jgi:hypothetical protein